MKQLVMDGSLEPRTPSTLALHGCQRRCGN